MENGRKLIVKIEVDDDKAIAADVGTIDYLENALSTLASAGILLINARVLDNDDPEDEDNITKAEEIFDTIW